MRIRTVITGITAGAICLAAWWFQFYTTEVFSIVPGWFHTNQAAMLPGWMTGVILIFSGLVIFIFGWINARWNWADHWLAGLQSGSGMGLLAGCLIFDFVGVAWYSLHGQAEILMNYYNPLSDVEGTRILIEAIFITGTSLYMNFAWVLIACAALGGLGGLFSTVVGRTDFWGRDPRKPEVWLFRVPAYLLTIFGYLNMIVTVAVLSLLWEKTLNSAIKLDKQYDIQWSVKPPGELFVLYGYLVGLIFIFLPVGITWGWIIRSWYVREKANVLGAVWIFSTTIGIAWVLMRYFSNGSYFQFHFEPILLMLVFLFGLGVGLTAESTSAGTPYHFSDWVGYALTCGILGGTQTVMGVVAYSIALSMIAIVNIPHLIKSELVAQSPVDQVVSYITLQSNVTIGLMLASLVLGIFIAWAASLVRKVMGNRKNVSAIETRPA